MSPLSPSSRFDQIQKNFETCSDECPGAHPHFAFATSSSRGTGLHGRSHHIVLIGRGLTSHSYTMALIRNGSVMSSNNCPTFSPLSSHAYRSLIMQLLLHCARRDPFPPRQQVSQNCRYDFSLLQTARTRHLLPLLRLSHTFPV